ncbi:MAG: histidine kinase [Chloroflexota bacterium]
MDQQVRFFPNINQQQQAAIYRTVWFVVTTAVLVLITIATPLRYRMLQSDIYNYGEGLNALGLSLDFFAAYFVSWELVVIVVSMLVAGLIVWKRADDWFAMLVALGLSLFGLVPPLIDGLRFANSLWAVPISALRLLIMGMLMAIFCLFPNGRFQPNWTRWLLVAWSLFSVGVLLTNPLMLTDTAVLPNTKSWQDAIWLLIGVAWFSVAIAGQVMRYRRYATPLEKQQLKWVLLGFAILVLFSIASAILLVNNPAINNSAVTHVRFTLVMGAFYLLLALAFPATISLAMLRYRLWDVDILLNRTLVYGGLTGLVTAVYILLVGSVRALATGAQSQSAAVAVATVVVLLGIRPFYSRLNNKVNRLFPIQKATPQPTSKAAPAVVKWLKVVWGLHLFLLILLFVAGLIEQANHDAFLNPNNITQFSELAITRLMAGGVLGHNPRFVSWILGASYGQAIAFAAVGLFIFWRKSQDVMGIVASWMFIAIGIGFTPTIVSLPLLAPAWHMSVTLFQISMFGSGLLFLALFPDGRLFTRWSKLAFVGWFTFKLLWLTFTQLNLHRSTAIWPAFIFAASVTLGLIAQLFRYHTIANSAQKQQTKWIIFGFLLANSGLIAIGALTELNLMLSSPVQALGFVFLALGPVFIPATVAVALLRYQLWQIDIIINRTLVYGGLSLGIVAVYVLVVGALGMLFQAQDNVFLALLATGFIAVLFQPVRERLQRASNRLMFGERDDPYRVLSKLGSQLQINATPEAMLQSVVLTIASTLKLPYVGIEIENEQGRLHGAATGKAVADTSEFPLRYQNETVGYLVVSPRSPSEPFSNRERQLLTDIAGQTGAAAYSVRLTTALQRSREKLVLTREEERRRLRRDLHDGLGPTLASQTFALDAALDLLESDPQTAAKLLQGLKAQNQETVADIRRLVYELRPPSLDELGLVGALQAHIAKLNDLRFHITVQPNPLPPLSAAVEVAAYRITLEAITNVVRHANASLCEVDLRLGGNGLHLEIGDDGCGLGTGGEAGVGLYSMRERAEELGGFCRIGAGAEGGTRVTAVLPV